MPGALARPFGASAAMRSHENSTRRPQRTDETQLHLDDYDSAGISPELVNSIFGGITKTFRGKRFALLVMDDSGRWRAARNQELANTSTGPGS